MLTRYYIVKEGSKGAEAKLNPWVLFKEGSKGNLGFL